MESDDQNGHEEVTEAVQLDGLAFDWTDGVPIDEEVVRWAINLEMPATVSGVDYSRAVSHAPDGAEDVG